MIVVDFEVVAVVVVVVEVGKAAAVAVFVEEAGVVEFGTVAVMAVAVAGTVVVVVVENAVAVVVDIAWFALDIVVVQCSTGEGNALVFHIRWDRTNYSCLEGGSIVGGTVAAVAGHICTVVAWVVVADNFAVLGQNMMDFVDIAAVLLGIFVVADIFVSFDLEVEILVSLAAVVAVVAVAVDHNYYHIDSGIAVVVDHTGDIADTADDTVVDC